MENARIPAKGGAQGCTAAWIRVTSNAEFQMKGTRENLLPCHLQATGSLLHSAHATKMRRPKEITALQHQTTFRKESIWHRVKEELQDYEGPSEDLPQHQARAC